MSDLRSDWCGYEWPADCERVQRHHDQPIHQSCCIRDPVEDAEQCMWHADPAETDMKTVEALAEARVSDEVVAPTSPYDELLDGAVLRGVVLEQSIALEDTALRGADLTGADLRDANLTGADLRGADLTGADIRYADLTEADLRGPADVTRTGLRRAFSTAGGPADLSDADLRGADLTGTDLASAILTGADLANADLRRADLREADLSEANLRYADLSEANLGSADLTVADIRGATLTKVVLGNTTLSNVQINQQTQFTSRIRPTFGPRFRRIRFNYGAWNAHAKDSYKLAAKCSEEGLIGNARILTVWDRRARRIEALSSGRILTAVGSWLNWQATGHGISVRRVVRNMLILYLIATAIYLLFGTQTPEQAVSLDVLLSRPFLNSNVVDTLYFSIITFTTSPPESVSVGISQWVAMIETFAGTLLIVLLGYVLGNREQV